MNDEQKILERNIEDVKRDLGALLELSEISRAKHARCLAYLQKNQNEVSEWVTTMGVAQASNTLMTFVK